MRPVTRTVALSLFAALAGCDTTPVTAPVPDAAVPMAEAARAYLTLPATTPAAGQQVAVRLNARRLPGSDALGSFTVRIAFDTAGLRFLASEPSRDGMVLAQAANGVVTLAGASSAGFASEELAGVTLQVVDPAALQHLILEIIELTTTRFHEQRASTVVDQRLYRRPVVR
jgi:hypothetical protein